MISYNDPLQLSLLKLTSFNFQLEEIQNSLRNSSKNLNSSRSHSSFEIIEKIFDTNKIHRYSLICIFVGKIRIWWRIVQMVRIFSEYVIHEKTV